MYRPSGTGVVTKTGANGRVFIFEVEGLRQGENTDKLNFPIRRSGLVYVTVPYERMNQEMRRITRLGGKIVNIRPAGETSTRNGRSNCQSKSEPTI